jgi:hypothetical protein
VESVVVTTTYVTRINGNRGNVLNSCVFHNGNDGTQ